MLTVFCVALLQADVLLVLLVVVAVVVVVVVEEVLPTATVSDFL